jgi:putative membrane protein
MRTSAMCCGSVFMVAVMLSACTSKEASSRTVTSDSVRADSTAAARPDSAGMNRMSDANVLAELDAVNIADSTSGSDAAAKGTSADVKSYGRMMMTDHHKMRVRGQEVAQQQNLVPQMPANDPFRTAVDSQRMALTGENGRMWDSTYLSHEAAMHARVLGWITEVEQGRAEGVRTILNEARPVVQKHLDRAQELLAKFNKGPGQ